jgi:hypothetical protein
MSALCQKRTLPGGTWMSAKCQKQTLSALMKANKTRHKGAKALRRMRAK